MTNYFKKPPIKKNTLTFFCTSTHNQQCSRQLRKQRRPRRLKICRSGCRSCAIYNCRTHRRSGKPDCRSCPLAHIGVSPCTTTHTTSRGNDLFLSCHCDKRKRRKERISVQTIVSHHRFHLCNTCPHSNQRRKQCRLVPGLTMNSRHCSQDYDHSFFCCAKVFKVEMNNKENNVTTLMHCCCKDCLQPGS